MTGEKAIGKRRVVITGGSGLVGGLVRRELLSSGYDVIVLSRTPRAAGEVRWDGCTADGWVQYADGAYAIINLAGESISGRFLDRFTTERKRLILESRVYAGNAVVDAVTRAKKPPEVLVQMSASGYYGGLSGRITEASPRGSGFLSDVCGQWEASTLPVERLGVRRAVVRLGIVLDRSRGALPRMKLPMLFFAGGPLGSGEQGFPWIHGTDAASAIRFLIEHEELAGIYNVSSPVPLSNSDFTRDLAAVLRRPSWLRMPAGVLKALFGEVSSVVLDGQMMAPERLLKSGFNFRFSSAAAALADILS